MQLPFAEAAFLISGIEGIPAPFPLALGDGPKARLLLRLNRLAIKVLPRVFSFQFFVDLQTPADLDNLIRQSHLHAGASTDKTQRPLTLVRDNDADDVAA